MGGVGHGQRRNTEVLSLRIARRSERPRMTLGELLEEAEVAGVEVAYVGDAVQDHGDALDAHSEGEAADAGRIVGCGIEAKATAFGGDSLEDGGVDHAAAKQLDPAGVLALAATLAAAEDTGDLDVGGGLGEGEEAGEETGFDRRTEECPHGMVEGALEVGERNVGVDAEAFDLVKDGRMGGVCGIVAVHLAGNYDSQRRRPLEHRPDLDGAGVGAHQQPVASGLGLLVGNLERILRVAGWVVRGKVESFEIVEVGLNLRTERGGVAEVVEDLDDAIHGGEKRVRDAGMARGAWEGDIDSLRRLLFGGQGFGEQGQLDLLLELIEPDAEWLASFGGRGLEPGIGDELQAALLAAEPVEAKGLGILSGHRGSDFGCEGRERLVEGGVVVGGQMRDGVGHDG